MRKERPNAEAINDRIKLLFHRLIARRLKENPSLLDLARKNLARQRDRFGERRHIAEWEQLLDQGVEVVRREIVRRDERMTRLRISSPLVVVIDVRDEGLRRRVWRSAREALARQLDQARTGDPVPPFEIIDGVNDFASEDPRSPTSIARASNVETLIAILEEEYSRPSRAAGPLSTSLEWEEIKRRLTGIDPLEDEDETDGGVPIEEVEAMIEAAIERATRKP